MIPGGPARAYLDALGKTLRADAVDRILAEVGAHLEDSAATLASCGFPPEEAERIAVERMGPVEDLAHRFSEIPPLPDRVERTARFLAGAALRVLASLTVLFTALVGFFSVTDPDGSGTATAIKLTVGALLALASGVAFRRLPGRPSPRLHVPAAGVCLLAGHWVLVQGTHQALFGRDPEYYLPVAGAIMIGQGYLTLALLLPRSFRRRLRTGGAGKDRPRPGADQGP